VDSVYFQNSTVRIHAVAAGPADGPAVLLLHGFPEFWYGWRKQIEPLATAGFRVIVPDQRGYNLSSKPGGVASYALTELVSDVIAIADQLGKQKIFLAGHDWGAAVAWSTALAHPERIEKLVIINVPHPSVMRSFLRSRAEQMLRSWYILFFQTPWLPEVLFSACDFRLGIRTLLASSRPGTFSADDLSQYRAGWSQPGSLTAMINWYRAAVRYRTPFTDRESLGYCTNAELFTFSKATHWLQHEEPEKVSEMLVTFFQL
jgi:pimeloyl-ACP methyl ester carboxylesterase